MRVGTHLAGWVVGVCLSLGACAHQSTQVRRVGTDTVIDLSGKWNDADARATSDSLISECFAAGWLPEFTHSSGRKPSVRVRGIVNRTDEHIDALIFIKSIERAMVNSGKVRVLAQEGSELSSVEQEQQRAIAGHQADDSAVSAGNETGADFVVAVRLASVLDQLEGQRVKLYQVNFELISPTSGEKAWMGQHEIKKVVTQDRAKW